MTTTNRPETPKGRPATKSRFKAMAWSLVFILCSAIVLPTMSYLVTSDQAHAQVTGDENQRSNFWRAVRYGESGYSAVSGVDSGVLIDSRGQDWRAMRNGATPIMFSSELPIISPRRIDILDVPISTAPTTLV